MTMTDQIQKEIEKTVNMLPQTIPDYAFEKVTLDERFDKDFIVYKSAYVPVIENYSEIKNRRRAECYCTSCDTTFYAEQISVTGCHHANSIGFLHPDGCSVIYSSDALTCPYCNKTVKAVHTSVISKYTYHVADAYCATVHNINGRLAILTWVVEKKLDRSGNLTYISRRNEGIVIIKNKAFRITSVQRCMKGWLYFNRWELRKRYDEKIGKIDKEFIFLNDTEALYQTDSANSALPEYINGSDNPLIGAYMRIWSKYPNVENLVKQGLICLLNEAMSKCYSYDYSQHTTFSISLITKYLNLRRAKPHEILGIDKSELNLIKELDLDQLKFYIFIKSNSGIRLDTDLLKAASPLITRLQTFFEHKDINGYNPPIIKTINYLIKQRNLSARISPQYLIDYWNMLQMFYNAMPTEMLYPKNLVTEHDKVADLIKAKENQIIDKKIKEIAAESSYLSFKDDELGLFIRPAATQKELINEGEQLHHCVSTYARSVAEGKTLILFIRKVSEPDKSYFTLEYRNKVVQQNRGLRNCERTDDIILFEQHWLNYLKKNKGKRVGLCQK